jgi:arylsulfatase A-like enzyme
MATQYNRLNNERAPNIVLILTDDQGWGDLSFNGNTNLDTPNIDQLGNNGAVFEHFYVQPVCAPTRAELLTGRYYPKTGVRGVTQREEWINLDEITIGDVFKTAGYATGCFGKWHSGSAYPYHPNGRGFDEFFGFCCGHWSHYFDSTLEHNGKEVKTKGYIADKLTEKAMEFIDANHMQPFLCYVPLNTPHSPFQVPDKWFSKFSNNDISMRHESEKEDLDITRSVLAMCENIDWNVGRLVEKIEKLKLTRDTIFVYLSDNGPNSWRWNGGMRGKKSSTDEGGVRSPCFIKWEGKIKGGIRIHNIAGVIDLLPTLTDLAGIKMIEAKPLDGISLKPLLTGINENWPERCIYAHLDSKTSVRTQQYRAGGHAGGLYDMNEDPGQYKNMGHLLPELNDELQSKIKNWRDNVIPKQIVERNIPVGYTQFPDTYLNAQDGIPSGSIKWSSIHPNASYFINWVNTDDKIYWEVDIKTSGCYDITLMYACKNGDEGSEVEFEYNNKKVSVIIEEAFDSPLKDDADRVKRIESYEREFKPLYMGKIYLQKGKGKALISAKTMAGCEICDVRAVKVKLCETF